MANDPPHLPDGVGWLTERAGARRTRPEEEGAWRVVDALGLALASDRASQDFAVGQLHIWRGSGVVGLDYGLDAEDPTAGIGFVVTREAVEFRLPVVTWEEDRPVVGTFLWQRLDWKQLDRAGLAALARQALAAGRSVRRKCSGCGKRVALGRYRLQAARIVCFGCAREDA